MKRTLTYGLVLILLLSILVSCGKEEAVPDWFPEALGEEYAMDEKTYFSTERPVSNMTLPEGVELSIDGSELVWSREGESHLLARLPQQQHWEKVAAVTQVGVILQTKAGIWLANPAGEVRNLQFIGSNQIEAYAICEPYFYFASGGSLYWGRLDTGIVEKIRYMGVNGTITRLRLASNIDLELTICPARGPITEKTIGYCMVTKQTYDHSPITDSVAYREARNKDLLNLGRSIENLSYGYKKPAALQPLDKSPSVWQPPSDMTDAEYFAVERMEATNARQYYTYHINQNRLSYTPVGAKNIAVELGDLGEGSWRTVGGENAVGQFLFESNNLELWLYEKETGYRYRIGRVGEIQEYIPYGPLYFIVCNQAVYRGSLLSGRFDEVCRKEEAETAIIWSNDLIQVFKGNYDSRVISHRTGKTYRVSVPMNGGWTKEDWDKLYQARQADLDKMGVTGEIFVPNKERGSETKR